ncbi:stage II sporulation protein M [Alloiococcus sp. CFN-8]|uniref:stage II sporulation protein M n=1 Tax=Alloiococcus sp. CFN-8 TaxID=3416081 RepID=UPI003CF56F82
MKIEHFINRYTDTWKELEVFSSRISQKGLKSLNSLEAKRLLQVFRITSHNLAYARTHFPDNKVVTYLNALVGRCHNQIYSVKKFNPKEFFLYIFRGFPEALKESKWYMMASFGFFFLGFLLSLVMIFINTDNAYYFLDAPTVEHLKAGIKGATPWNDPLMASFLMVNNIGVALRALVFGITLGIGTIYVLFINGLNLGAFTALAYGFSDPAIFWSLILPHGVIELTAIFLSGGAGLIIARSILVPGEHKRRHSIIIGAKKAISIIAGVALLLVIAGIIEGFITPMDISVTAKLSFAALTAVLLALYFYIPYKKKK